MTLVGSFKANSNATSPLPTTPVQHSKGQCMRQNTNHSNPNINAGASYEAQTVAHHGKSVPIKEPHSAEASSSASSAVYYTTAPYSDAQY